MVIKASLKRLSGTKESLYQTPCLIAAPAKAVVATCPAPLPPPPSSSASRRCCSPASSFLEQKKLPRRCCPEQRGPPASDPEEATTAPLSEPLPSCPEPLLSEQPPDLRQQHRLLLPPQAAVPPLSSGPA
uniref:Uncharacterized protein n=1 Tax=Arundo donax TaxID=35708 RepID=A0A0A9CZG0_ARUDO